MTAWRIRSSHRLARAIIGAAMAVAVLVTAGCGDSDTAADHLAKAQRYRAEGKYPAAMIELKNALAKAPKDLPARLLAAQLNIDLGSGDAALGMLRRAVEDGASERDVAKPRTEAQLLIGRYDEVMGATAVLPEGLSTEAQASMLCYRSAALVALHRLDEAQASLDDARALDPRSVDVLGAGIRLKFAAGDLAGARRAAEEAQAIAPGNFMIGRLAGDIAITSRDFDKATRIFSAIVESAPWNDIARASLAVAQIGQHKLTEAFATLDAVDELTGDDIPRHPVLNYVRSIAAYQNNDMELAQSSAEQTVLAAPAFTPARLIAGVASYRLHQYERAYYYLTFYVDQVPTNEQARRILGLTELMLGRADKAAATLRPALQQHPDDPELLALIGVAAEHSGDLAAAAGYLARALQQWPDNAQVRTELGRTELVLGNIKNSIAALQKVAEAQPGAPTPQMLLFLGYLNEKHYDEALAAAQRVEKLLPESPAGFVMEGAVHLAKGDKEAGRQALMQARGLNHGDINSNRNLAALAIGDGKLDDARQYYRDILAANPRDSQTYIDLAQIEGRIGEPVQAEATLVKAVEVSPNDPLAHAALAAYRLARGELAAALLAGEPALKKFPDDGRLLHIVCRTQLQLGRRDAALLTAQAFARKHPRNAQAHIDLADAYLALRTPGHPQWAAIAEAQEAVNLAPAGKPAREVLPLAWIAHDRLADARTLVDKLKSEYPDDLDVARLDGVVAQRQGQLDKAGDIFAHLVSVTDDGIDRRLLAEVQLKQGHPDEMAKTITGWLDTHPRDIATRKMWAEFCVSSGRLAEASEQFAELIRLAPADAAIRNNLAWVLLRLGKPPEALARAREALSLAPGSANVQDTLGVMLLKNGLADDAVEQLQQAWQKDPDTPEIGFHLSQALAAAERKGEALVLLRNVLAGDEAFKERAQAQELLHQLGG